MSSTFLEFVPISSSINPSFWNKLSEIKLNIDKLNEREHQIWGYFSHINNQCRVPILEVNSTSFNKSFDSQRIYIPFHGKILNKNTIEQFKDADKTKIINEVGQTVLQSIENGEALQIPSMLNQFYILSFMDLKKFFFYYWFAFPVPHNLSVTCNHMKNISDVFTFDQQQELWEKYCELENHQKPYFLVYLDGDSLKVDELKSKIRSINEENFTDFYFTFYDISHLDKSPGSTLRNYIALILHECPFLNGKSVNFLSLRLKRNDASILTISNTLILNLQLPHCQPSLSEFISGDIYKGWVGWEKNERGKLGPRLSNMKSFMDPKELAESSVDLNLKLMKWRILSTIDLEKIKKTNFLLLGSGTLGCSVARILLGWGARNISFVDNSVVSYSNPVRQSLFTFEDSKNAKPKALAAAHNLRNIFPGVNSKSFQITIPMPGHSIGESMLDEVKKNVEILTSLIQEHDVIFLLMDSRESRWLPTVLGAYFKKIVINAALGFDSFLVMRHGVRVDLEELRVRQYPPGFKCLKGNYLGCYFCNDVTAPGDSMKDRTLDQQCTVTRPGVSAIAGALSAELAISLLHHKEGAKASAFYQIGNATNKQREIDNQCILGIIPHSIRGYLSTFSQVLPATERYKLCVACSDIVQTAYGKDGFSFLLKVFQNSKFLEDITGLTTSNKEAEDIGVWEFSDEEEIECTNYVKENKLEVISKMSDSSIEVSNSRDEVVVEYHTYRNINETEIVEPIESCTKITDKAQINQDCTEEKNSCKDTTNLKLNNSGELNDIQNTIKKIIADAEMNCDSFQSKIRNISVDALTIEEKLSTSNADQEFSSRGPLAHTSENDIKCDLSKNIVSILEKKNIISSAESLIMENRITGLGETDLTKKHSLVTTQSQPIPKEDDMSSFNKIELSVNEESSIQSENMSVIERISSSASSIISMKNPANSTSSENCDIVLLPNELLPILEKQKAVNSARFILNKQMTSRFQDNIISLKSKVKNFVSSESVILSAEEANEQSAMLQMCRSNDEEIDVEKDHVPHSEGLQKKIEEYKEWSPPSQLEIIEKYMGKIGSKRLPYSQIDDGIYNPDLITLKSTVECLVSSDSLNSTDNEYNDTLPNENNDTLPNETIKSSILDHLKKRKELLTIIARNLITSSESLSSSECTLQQEDTHACITEDKLNSSSLESENLKLDESVYYLAETDCNKFVSEH